VAAWYSGLPDKLESIGGGASGADIISFIYENLKIFRIPCASNSTMTRYHRYKRTHKNCELKKKYGITVGDYDNLLAKQNFCCAICLSPTHKGPKPEAFWPVDHCHATNKVRALLCFNCNAGLGHFKDNPVVMESAILYLAGTGEKGAV
jgi:hypothetical protein